MQKLFLAGVVCAGSLLMLNANAAGYKYDPDQYQQYQNTGKCEGCNLTNADIDYDGAVDLKNADICQSEIKMGADMQNSDFTNAMAPDMDWRSMTHVDLTNSNFTNANLQDDTFDRVDLSGVNFTGADLKGASMDTADLTRATLTDDQIKELASDCNARMPDGSLGTICP